MKSNYKIVIVITLLLLILSTTISIINYMVSLNSTQTQLKTQSLPLSLDNIYTEIQKHIIEPYLVSSMMANDTFVKDWIIHEEDATEKIEKYLDTIKNKYGMFVTFLVSEKSKNYYTQSGLLEKVEVGNPNNKWYFDFKKIQNAHEINLDFNKHLSNSLVMFINFKIFDINYNFIGATGVGLEISYIDDMLKRFRQKYNFRVYFLNKYGEIVLSEEKLSYKNINQVKELNSYKSVIFSKTSNTIEYQKEGNDYILTTKYAPELGLYIAVEVKLNDFTKDVRHIFYFNLSVSLIITLIITFIIITIVRKYHSKIEHLADTDALTKVANRRCFSQRCEYFLLLNRRKKSHFALLFLDIDNFKSINDKFGHEVGDFILKESAKTLQHSIRKTDLIGRWGGEEFVVMFIDTTLDEAKIISEKLRVSLENNIDMKKVVGKSVTASFGLTICKDDDTLDSAIARADSAMYQAKKSGKNRVISII